MKTILVLIRWKNLLIIGLTLLALRYFSVSNYALSSALFGLLMLGNILIAAAGNIINDILDYNIDKINKPKQIIIHQKMPIRTAWFLYFGSNILAIFIGFWIANIFILSLFVVAILWLFLYSKYFKKMPLIGNLSIAFLCSLIILEFWWIEQSHINEKWQTILGFYAVFAFIATWIRELTKDFEDLKGDHLGGCQTLPIWWGKRKAFFLLKTLLVGLFFILLIEIYFFYQQDLTSAIVYSTIFLVLPILLFIQLLNHTAYSKLSQLLKYYLLSGLILLFFV